MNNNNTLAQYLGATPFQMMTRSLPNGAGSYGSPVVAQPTAPVKPSPVKPLFQGNTTTTTAPVAPAPNMTQYINPDTGVQYTPEQYADTVAAKLTQAQTGPDVPNYAGNQLTEGPQTTDQLNSTATDLNNARNDIATGTTDPYKVASKSGINYTAAELKAIESAYAGVYDPALKTALAKLTDKQKADTAAQTLKDAEAKTVFDTNEAIRQWRATTGSKASSTDNFTTTQSNAAAGKLGMGIAQFDKLDPDLKNFFINTPKGTDPKDSTGNTTEPMDEVFKDHMKMVTDGTETYDSVAKIITDSSLPEVVKAYYINKIPADPAKKASWLDGVFGAVGSAAGTVGNFLQGALK